MLRAGSLAVPGGAGSWRAVVYLAWYRDERDWAALRKVCMDPEQFGDSYLEFARLMDRKLYWLTAQGTPFTKITVRPGEFALWCALRKMMPSRGSLEAYVTETGYRLESDALASAAPDPGPGPAPTKE